MNIRYSKSGGNFYPYYIDYPFIPADVQDVSMEVYYAAMNRPVGATFSIDADGVLTITSAPTPTITDESVDLCRKIDADVDAIYDAVIGNRATEYLMANSDATAYKVAGYTGTVPASVAAWATAAGETEQWAADNILATAANWMQAQASIRAQRLLQKQTAKSAKTKADIDAVKAAWESYVISIRAQLGA